jgi:hypothetical protein
MWHEHLSEYLGDKENIARLLALTKLPTSVQGIAWLGAPLRQATVAYLHDTARQAGRSHIATRCLLHECPTVNQHGILWQPLSNEGSIATYAATLHKWVHAVLVTCEPNDPSGYTFPLTDDDRLRAKALKAALHANDQSNRVRRLHEFIKPLLYPLDRSMHGPAHPFSKWDEVIECLQALMTLKADGNFEEASNVTQMYAQMAYHIRAAILYEGHLKVTNFGGDLHR